MVSGFSYSDPLAFINGEVRKKRTQRPVSWWPSQPHRVYRSLLVERTSGEVHSVPGMDNHWDCSHCRPRKVSETATQVVASFSGLPMFVEVIDNQQREAARKRAERRGIDYWSVPIGPTGLQVALLLTGALTDNSEAVVDRLGTAVAILELKGGGNMGRSKGLRTGDSQGGGAAEDGGGYWEGYHLGTYRHCGHLHLNKADAQSCARETGWHLDGSIHHWYARRASAYAALGSVSIIDGAEVSVLLGELGIPHVARDSYIVTDPVRWDDARFVEFRLRGGWRRPPMTDEAWLPPAYPVEIAISPTGTLSAHRATGGRQ